ncbi:MAG: VWA domain-containing protein [Armatimonadetes bacterium]|nr:VWA domain-containing protein [Armatimonadota bacterium]MDW8121343.1 VWA domain-containing protein [Armatimonadota bacterium]
MSESVKLSCRLAREKMLADQGPQVVYALAEIIPIGEGIGGAGPVNVAFVLDRSGSMAGEKVRYLREAVKLALDGLDSDDIVTIVIFDDQVEVLAPAAPVVNRNELKRKVDQITDRGGTHISLGIERALSELLKNYSPDRVNRMILLTDGQTYGDEAQCRDLARQLAEKKIPLIAFGLGEDWNEEFLDDMAAITSSAGGFSEFIDQPDKIVDFFQRVVSGAKKVVARDAFLTVRLSAGVTPRRVWRVRPLIGALSPKNLSDRDIQVSLGDLERDEGQSVLMELTVAKKPKGLFRICQVEVSHRRTSDQKEEKVRQDVVVEFVADPAQAQKVDAEMMRLVEKVTAHQLQTRALEAARAGDRGTATRLLRQAATRLLNLGESGLAQEAQREADRLERGEDLTPTGTKRLRYETRRLSS